MAMASCLLDHSSQRGSSVATSIRTFVSTRTWANSVLAAREGHDLVGAHAHMLQAAAQPSDRPLGTGGSTTHRFQQDFAAADLELDFRVRQQSRFLPDSLRDGDLPLARDSHRLSPVIPPDSKNLTSQSR